MAMSRQWLWTEDGYGQTMGEILVLSLLTALPLTVAQSGVFHASPHFSQGR